MNRWDSRYDEERYFYGTAPNYFVARCLPELPSGRGLFLAEGEGRNVVFAAGLGHEVLAVDSSAVGRRKALDLAEQQEVRINYRLADVVTDDWDSSEWDFIVFCFAHLPPEQMTAVHRRTAACLRPGGKLILQSFAKAQFGRHSGGPPDLAWLHDLDQLQTEFPGVVWNHAAELEVELNESVGHFGRAVVIELLGTKAP